MKHLERARALGPSDPTTLAALAFGRAVGGNASEAQRLLEQLVAQSVRRYVSPVLPAFVHAALGRRDRAFELLERAYVVKDPHLIAIRADVRASTLRADPRYADLVRRMGLTGPVPALTASR